MIVRGIVHLHDISRDDLPPALELDVELLSKLCGDDTMAKVAFVTTKWDRLRDVSEGQKRVAQLEAGCWAHALRHGASIFHLQPDGMAPSPGYKAPWDIIRHLIENRSLGALRIQEEVVHRGRSVNRVLHGIWGFFRKTAKKIKGPRNVRPASKS